MRNINHFFEDLHGKKVLFCGMGVTNIPLIKMFAKRGITTLACDKKPRADFGEDVLSLENIGAKLIFENDDVNSIDCDIIFRTPGLYFNCEMLSIARTRGKIVTGEMEVLIDYCPSHTIGITGSDGKTTTTTLISEILTKAGKTVHKGGNIGKNLLADIEKMQREDFVVAEISSFQLISMRNSPDVSIVTNMSENHLDVHKDMPEYIDAKRNIFLHQSAFGSTIINLDNDITKTFAPGIRGIKYEFSRKIEPRRGAFVRGNKIFFKDESGEIEIMKVGDIALKGTHNVENYLAAICATIKHATPNDIKHVAQTFNGVEHRCQLIKDSGKVKWYNDSIATTPSRTTASLAPFEKPVILIAGGYDKNLDYNPVAPTILQKAKILILMGATAGKIETAVKSHKNYNASKLEIIHAQNLQDAVKIANGKSAAGDEIVLSPASASFDCFKNFEERGYAFKKYVNEL